jgi:hypothetical protein
VSHGLTLFLVAFVKLDCGILDSTIWFDPDARILFITAMLMAAPYELLEPEPGIAIRTLDKTGFVVPAGWYGHVKASGIGIISRSKSPMTDEQGLAALERLASPEPVSGSTAFEGRRMIRVNGGYLILNFSHYREKDHTSAERSKRYREKKMGKKLPKVMRMRHGASPCEPAQNRIDGNGEVLHE